MSGPGLEPGPPASPDDLHRAEHLAEQLYGGELRRVRTAADSWRNGLAGLLLGLAGFGLVKGRSDIGGLAPAAMVWVGVLLLAAVLAGAAGAWLLLRASHGTPAVVAVRDLAGPVPLEHRQALDAARDLRRARRLVLLHAALLVAAVGVTWYGPGREGPRLLVTTPDLTACGKADTLKHGRLTLRTAAGRLTVDLRTAQRIVPVETCPPP